MSNNIGISVWVGDLHHFEKSAYFNDTKEQSRIELENELDEIGDLQLLAGKSISAQQLYQKGISPSEWRHSIHKSEMTIGFRSSKVCRHAGDDVDSPVNRFLKGMLDLGRPYAIARYARWENIDYPSAITSTLPYGIRALVNQLLASEGITRNGEVEEIIRSAMNPFGKDGIIAYLRTGILQSALHQIANESSNHPGGAKLDRLRMKAMLSLARLHFSIIELKITSIDDLRLLLINYENARSSACQDDARFTTKGRFIRSWRVRHIQPLINLYPYSIRYGLGRALNHNSTIFDRADLVNELALAHCGILVMRAAGKSRVLYK